MSRTSSLHALAALLAISAVAGFAPLAFAQAAKTAPAPSPSLYKRLGGYDAIAAVDTRALDANARRFVAITLRDYRRAGVTLDDVREALASIDPDCDYRTWYEIAAALRHHFTDEDEAREAFETYDVWSSTGSKYKGRDETMLKWRSFKPYPEGRNPITLRSLFHHAITAGWKPEKFTKRLAEDFAAWCGGATQDDLMGEGVRRIGQPLEKM